MENISIYPVKSTCLCQLKRTMIDEPEFGPISEWYVVQKKYLFISVTFELLDSMYVAPCVFKASLEVSIEWGEGEETISFVWIFWFDIFDITLFKKSIFVINEYQ